MVPTQRDPISEGWFQRGIPIDTVGHDSQNCIVCDKTTPHTQYRAIVGAYAGLGAPAPLRIFMKRQSTRGKIGQRSLWSMCEECGSLFPIDEAAHDVAISLGQMFGFLDEKPD